MSGIHICNWPGCNVPSEGTFCREHRILAYPPLNETPLANEMLAAGGPVIHPAHYNATKYEAWDVLDVWFEHDPLLWTAGKYLARAPHSKKQIQDLEKAVNYIRRRIDKLKASDDAK